MKAPVALDGHHNTKPATKKITSRNDRPPTIFSPTGPNTKSLWMRRTKFNADWRDRSHGDAYCASCPHCRRPRCTRAATSLPPSTANPAQAMKVIANTATKAVIEPRSVCGTFRIMVPLANGR